MGTGQGVHAARRLLSQLIHGLAAGVGETQHTGGLVEALACRIVTGSAQNLHVGVVRHIHDQRIAAGDGQRQKRRLQFRKGQIVGGDVTPHMVHRDQRNAQRPRGGFGEADAHQHRTDQARRVGDGHRVNIPLCQSRVAQRLIRQSGDGLYMLAGRDLRHHAAVQGVHVRLGENGVGQ